MAFKVCLLFKKMDRLISDVSQSSVIVPILAIARSLGHILCTRRFGIQVYCFHLIGYNI